MSITEILKLKCEPMIKEEEAVPKELGGRMKLRIDRDTEREGFGYIEDYIRKHPKLNEDYHTKIADKK